MMAAMTFRHQLKYDASPDEVYAMLCDPAFRERVCEAMHTVSHDVAVDATDTGTSLRIDMVQRTQGVPGFARRIIGDETRIIQYEQWTTDHKADLKLEIPGKPGNVRGRLSLSGDASGTVESFEGKVTVKIALIGGKLEGFVEKLFTKEMDTEHRVGAAWLAGER